MIEYESAILENESAQFLLGRGKYFVPNRDWGGHDITSTQEELRIFAKKYGEENLYIRLDFDIQTALDIVDLSSYDINNILSLIWWYYYNRAENKLTKPWIISKKIQSLIRYRLNTLHNAGVNTYNEENIINRLQNTFDISFMDDLKN